MIFNGHTSGNIDAIDEETFSEICVMYADGILGGKGVYEAITPLTTAVFNYIRPPSTPAYKSTQIFPWVIEYEQNPDLDYNNVQDNLLSFMAQAPDFSVEKFNVKNREL
jgi:hypothetical protein